jgi:hypothetical protein
LLVDNDLGSEQFLVLAPNGFQKLFHLLAIGITLIGILVESVETLRHDFGALFKTHAALITVIELIKLRLSDCRTFTEFSFAIAMRRPGKVRCASILSRVMGLNPGPSR